MQWSELRDMARGQVEQARAVLNAFPCDSELAAVTLTDPARSAQSFGTPSDELSWFDLIIFHRTIREARNRDIDAFCELPPSPGYRARVLPGVMGAERRTFPLNAQATYH